MPSSPAPLHARTSGEVSVSILQPGSALASIKHATRRYCRRRNTEQCWCRRAGCEGVAAINTIQSVMGINLDTLRPEPSVEGYSTPGGYSSKAVKPIALAKACSQPSMGQLHPVLMSRRCSHCGCSR